MHLRPIDYVLWLTAPTLQLGVLAVMYKRGLQREYPYFFYYTILAVANEPILFFAQRSSYSLYYYCYWISIALTALVSFAVLYEIFQNAFRPYEALRDLSVILFRWSALVILLVAGMWAVTSNHPAQDGSVTNAVLLAERSVRLMQCGLVFFLLLFSEYLGISRRNLLFGIALGFGFFASVSMLVVSGLSHAGVVHVSVLRWVHSAAYNISVLIWLGYSIMAPSPSSAFSAIRSPEWNSALEDARVPEADSLLDSMDRTVERLLYLREEAKANVPVGPRAESANSAAFSPTR
jgi:hypothetical protein